jgi:hypothetical protein
VWKHFIMTRFIIWILYLIVLPVMVAKRSGACTVFARSEAGTVVSNPTQGMDVCWSKLPSVGATRKKKNNSIKFIKSRRITSIGHVSCRDKWEILTKFLPGNCEENKPLERTRRRCRMVLIWISETCCVSAWLDYLSFLYSRGRDVK